MTSIKFVIVCLALNLSVQVSCSDKGSLTFVIDDTESMGSDIQQVRDSADGIADVILNNPHSQIEDIVLVTFNDPDVELRTVTKSREEFKSYLGYLYPHGGGDCPERSLTGTELALEKSSPSSYLYVFTDDSDDEEGKEVRIQRIIYSAQKKQSQIVFIITPNDFCKHDKVFDDYYRIADASTGQVFRLTEKAQVQQVLNYVKETVSGQRTVLVHKIIRENMWEDIPFTLDSRTEYAIVSSSGNNVVLQLKEGPTHNYESVSWTDNIKVMKINVPGDYIIRVKSGGVTSIVVFGRTDFSFSHGFSEFLPTSMEYTRIQPVKGSKPYLAIKLKSENGDVRLNAVKILDVKGNVLLDNIPLRLVDTEQKIYVTERFDLPTDEAFKISTVGHDMETAETIYRESLPIVPQNPDLDATITKKNKSPVITIVEPKITVIYEESVELKCIVNAFPKPDIIWIDTATGSIIPSEVSTIELPFDYISVIVVNNVTSNNTYECKAVNTIGEDSKSIKVETFRKHYFNVLGHINRTMTLDFIEESRFTCLADAYPPASITWYRDGSEVLNDSATELSEDGSALIIKPMQLRKNGEDIECKLVNEDETKSFKCHISVIIEVPVIDPSLSDRITKVEGSTGVIKCKTVKGRPTPEHRWYFRSTFFKNSTRVLLNGTTEDLYLGNVNKFMSGMYTCQANNIMGTDSHTTYLEVVYPPNIVSGAEEITAVLGERINLHCEVSGAPTPDVRWFLNGTEIEDGRFDFYKDNRLGFNVKAGDDGLYTCKAVNSYGVEVKNVKLKVLVPAFINVPYYSTIERLIDDNLTLECDAGGYPKPNISWTHFLKDGRPPEKLTIINDDNTLILSRLKLSDAGFYMCTAQNLGDKTDNITYEVKVGAKPFIENVNENKTFTGTNGDAFLSISCKVRGAPKPDVTWFYRSDGDVGGELPVSVDGAFYYQEEDGTLIVKNIDKSFEGYYVCQAKNNHGETNETYRLIVTDHPAEIRPTSTLKVEEGTSVELKCNVSHSLLQMPRWFRDGEEIGRGRYYLYNATSFDSGIYTCRVSDITGSRSESQEVKVGSAPRFSGEKSMEDVIVKDLNEGVPAVFNCSAEGKPSPQVTWYYNGKKVNYSNMIYEIETQQISNRGYYSCNVSNEMGSIKREFVIRAESQCLLPVEDMDEYTPLMYDDDEDINWKKLITREKYLITEARHHILLYCSQGFVISSKKKIDAVCKNETNFFVNKNPVDFSDLKCKTKTKPTIKRTGRTCLFGNEVIEIGFWIFHKFLSVYEVCFDVLERIPIYANITINSFADTIPKTEKWYDNVMIPFDQPSLYDCVRQNAMISSVVHDWPHESDRCCFAKRQLVNPRDLSPGLNQLAAYNPMNVLPHWGTCNSINWDEIENRIRKLSLDIENLQVLTGRSKSNLDTMTIQDKRRMSHPIPRYIWKVVRDPGSAKSLAIIQVNVPDLKLSEASRYILCRDICSSVVWLHGKKWRDVNNGFTYCCRTQEFQKAFGFDELLDSTNDGILLDILFESLSY